MWKHSQLPSAPVLTTEPDLSNPLFVDMDSGVGCVMQSPGELDSSAVRLQSNLDELDDWDNAPLSNPCDESETLVGAALARSVPQQEAAQETQNRHAKSLKLAERVAKRKLMAQPQISHASAEQLKSREPRTDEPFVGFIHASHQLALLQKHSKVFYCSQCGAENAGGSLRLLKSQCDGPREIRRKARRKLERGLMLNAQVP